MRALLALVLAVLVVTGCAARAARQPPGVPVDARPTPPQPPPEPAPAPPANSGSTKKPATAPAAPAAPAPPTAPVEPPAPVESVMTPDERRQALGRIAADTTAAGTAVRRCVGRKLLPDQESVFDAARSLLDQARAALARDELWRAESLARKARQLAASLSCPG